MSLLKQFEQQYSTQTAEITAKIGRLQLLDNEERRRSSQTISRLLSDVEDLLEQMELSVREITSGSAERQKYENRVKSYRSDKQALEKELEKALKRLNANSNRAELFTNEDGAAGSGEGMLSEEHRTQLIDNTERLERTSRKLDDSYKIAVETEQIGADVLANLETQRDTIGRSRDRMREAEADLGQSSKVLSGMIRRVIQNRMLIILVGAILFFVLGFLIYLGASKKN